MGNLRVSHVFSAYCLTGAMLCSSMINAAQLTNRNFESADLSGWSFINSPRSPSGVFGQAVDSTFGVPTLEGDYSALLVTRGYNCSDDGWGIGCPVPIPFTSAVLDGADPLGIGYEAAISQQIRLDAGDAITFDFQLFTNDNSLFPIPELDFAGTDTVWVSLWNGKSEPGVVTLACAGFNAYAGYYCPLTFFPDAVIIAPPPVVIRRASGTPVGFEAWGDIYRWTISAPSDDVWTLTVGVGGLFDSILSSGLLVDNFHISPRQALPEPGSLALFVLIFAGLGVTGRKKT